MPAASKILDDLAAEFGETAGVVDVPTGGEDEDLNKVGTLLGLGNEPKVPIKVNQVRETLKRTRSRRRSDRLVTERAAQ